MAPVLLGFAAPKEGEELYCTPKLVPSRPENTSCGPNGEEVAGECDRASICSMSPLVESCLNKRLSCFKRQAFQKKISAAALFCWNRVYFAGKLRVRFLGQYW